MTTHGRNRWLPALLLLAAASAASLWPGALVLDRAAFLRGEVWRLWTGHLVHHTPAHFVFDVGVGVALLLVRPRIGAWFVLMPLVGGAVLLARPDLATYAGLSGVLHGATVLVGLSLLPGARGFDRLCAGGLVAGVFGKATYEMVTGSALVSSHFPMGGETLFVAHLAGALAGLAIACLGPLVSATLRPCAPRSSLWPS